MNKEFISYEQALELKELGFDEECLAYWTRGINGYYKEYDHYTNKHWMFNTNDNKDRHLMCTAPLYQQAFRWFREKYGLVHSIGNQDLYLEKGENIHIGIGVNPIVYQEAELSCLKKLIEIAKNK